MRVIPVVVAAVLLIPDVRPAQAQDWSEFLFQEDFFSINFPDEPKVTPTTGTTDAGLTLPGRLYSYEDSSGKYSVTVLDWREARKMHDERSAACKAGTGDLRGGENPGVCGNGLAGDIGNANLRAMLGFIQRGSQVTALLTNNSEGAPGIRIQLLNKDGSRTIGISYWHEFRQYIVEGTSPKGMPPPAIFPVSFQLIDQEGRRIRYAEAYRPLAPPPARVR